MSSAAPTTAPSATIVIQTRLRDGADEAFGRWGGELSAAAAVFPGFIEQNILPPNMPAQADWVILQRFAGPEAAIAWLRSDQRLGLIDTIQALVAGPIDVHLVRDSASGVLPAPASVVVSTRVRPGQESGYRLWERRIAAAQARAQGFQGYRLEPPIPGVQDDWLAILRFDTEQNLQAWLESPARAALLGEAEPFIEEYHSRIVRTGFEQWFEPGGPASAPAWKQNMVVLMLLYPIVFLFGLLVQTPYLMKAAGMPFWLALFVGNVFSVLSLSVVVPRVSRLFGWWLTPRRDRALGFSLAGGALVIAIYLVCMVVFARLS